MMKIIGLTLLGFIVLLGFVWIAEGNDFFMYKVFAPAQAAVERQTFEQTKSYNQGMIQTLRSEQLQYENGDDKTKDMVAAYVWGQYADYNQDMLPGDLKNFMSEVHSRLKK
jgi:hypothetical protein